MADTAPPGEAVAPADFLASIPDRFEHESFRYEQLDLYDSPATRERLARFLAGEGIDPRPREHWLTMLRNASATGRAVRRVHAIGPVNDYLRMETAAYKQNAAAGEDIRLMDRARAITLGLPGFDFYLFDGHAAAVMKYTARGVLRDVEIVTDPAFTARCRIWRDIATSNSVPLSEYQAGRTAA
jgi:hypothetical protein